MTQYTEKDMTPFFPADVKPEREGVYQTNVIPGAFQYWTGKYWGCWTNSPAGASHDRDVSMWQKPKWRGLSFDPSKEAK